MGEEEKNCHCRSSTVVSRNGHWYCSQCGGRLRQIADSAIIHLPVVIERPTKEEK